MRERVDYMVRGARGRGARRSMAVLIPGMILVAVLLFETTPLTVAICLPAGSLLILLGLLLWVRAGIGTD